MASTATPERSFESSALDVPERRPCTRCGGAQVLVGAFEGLGKFQCDSCGMRVGFDASADPIEFLLDRGEPARYTKNIFGEVLTATEIRLA